MGGRCVPSSIFRAGRPGAAADAASTRPGRFAYTPATRRAGRSGSKSKRARTQDERRGKTARAAATTTTLSLPSFLPDLGQHGRPAPARPEDRVSPALGGLCQEGLRHWVEVRGCEFV